MVIPSGTISALATALGLALTLVALFASWRVSKRSVSTQVYRDTAAAWESKSKAQDVENADLRTQLTIRDERIADLNGRVLVLQDTVTGARAWDTLERRTAEMLALAADGRAETRQIHVGVSTVLEELTGISAGCSALLDRLNGRTQEGKDT